MQRYAWTARNLSAPPGSGIVSCSPSPTPTGSSRPSGPCRARTIRSLRTLGNSTPTAATPRGRAPAQRSQGTGRPRRHSEWVTTSRISGSWCMWAHPRHRCRTTSRWASRPRPRQRRGGAAVPAADDRIWEYFATSTIPDPEQMTKLLDALNTSAQPHRSPHSNRQRTAPHKVDLMLKQLAVDGATERTPTAG